MTEMHTVNSAKAGRPLRIAAALVMIGAAALAGLWLVSPAFSTRGSDPLAPLTSSRGAPEATPLRGFEEVVERVKPAVFGIRARVVEAEPMADQEFLPDLGEPPNDPGEKKPPRPTTNQGSGFFISADGYAITTSHVIEHGKSIEIETHEGKKYPAKLVGSDRESDIALIKVDGENHTFVEFADEAPRIGEWVIAVGNPFGLGGTVTAGIVSARARDITGAGYGDFIQIDAPVNQGNSGGPTFDATGRVIGVNSAIVSPTGGSVGIGFAIPAEAVKAVAAELKEKGKVVRAWIGVRMQPITPEIADGLSLKETQGALVSEPFPHSPADGIGILSGDVIASLNGEPLKDDRELAKKVGEMEPGTQVELGIIRQGESKNVALTLGQLPDPPSDKATEEAEKESEGSTDPSSLGLALVPGKSLGPGAAGVVVTEVDPDGLAAERGFQAGDVILEVAGSAVNLPSDVKKALSEAQSKSRRNVIARVKSGDVTRFLAIPIG
jgi:serine protease Do